MKNKLFLTLIMMWLTLAACAQDKTASFIEVTGSAEMTLIPNDIELEIVLGNNTSSKLSVETLDKAMYDALDKNGISRSALAMVSVDNPYYWYYWWWDNRHYNNSKTYKLKLDCRTQNLSFINDIKPELIRNIRISRSSHSKITEFRRQVKVEAMKAAKEKASDLLEAIGQKAGKVFEVVEIPESINNNYWYGRYNIQNVTSNCIVQTPVESGDSNGAQVPSIFLRFEIKAKFEIL